VSDVKIGGEENWIVLPCLVTAPNYISQFAFFFKCFTL